ncbi:MAG: hypothetical protein ACYC43_05300 [Burkholderiales bacterium]
MKNLKNLYTWLVALLLALALGALPATGMAASSKVSKTLLIYETIGQAPAYPVSFKAYTSSLGYTAASGLSYNLAAAQEQQIAARITDLQPVTAVDGSGHPLSQNTLLGNAKTSLTQQYVNSLAGQMAAYMQTAGAATAIFNYQQQVMVQGNSQPMYLVWQLIVDGSGRPRYGDARLIPTVPNFVYANYTSKVLAATLPAIFAYPQAGTVQWQQVNQQIQPVTALQTINVNGAFDAPTAAPTASSYPAGCSLDVASGQVACDPDYGLKCLINHASDPYTAASPNPANPNDIGCPAVPINGYTDFISLENANGASGGYVDYVRSLTPVYTTSIDSNGDAIQTAAVTVSVDTRTMQESGNIYYTPIPAINGFDNNGNVVTYSGGNLFSDYPYTCSTGDGYAGGQTWPSYVAGYGCAPNTPVTLNNIYYTPIPTINNIDNNGNPLTYSGGNFFSDYPYTCTTGDNGYTGGQTWPSYVAGYSCTPNTPVTLNNIYYTPIPAINNIDNNGNPLTYSGGNFFSDYPYTCSTGDNGYTGGQTWPSYSISAWYGCTPNTPVTTLQNKFINTGRIGYEVQSMVNRYYVTPDGHYFLIGNVTANTIAPTQKYNKTVSLPSGSNSAGYAYLIIDPFNTTQIYDYRNDTINRLPAANYLYVAPIVTN